MKRLFSLLSSLFLVLTISAQLNGSGYYRVQNYGSKRYIYVADGYSSGINASTTSADMGAVQTWKDLNKAITDPASIIYIKKVGTNWDLMAQGTSVHTLINYYVDIDELSYSDNIYQVSATASGQTLYLYDGETSSNARGKLTTGSASGNKIPASYRRWQIFGLNQTDNYVALSPTSGISEGSKYYVPYYVSYPFSFYSSGMKAYYVKKVDTNNKVAVISELTGIVPSSTPVIIECSSSSVENNKLQLEDYEGYTNRPSDNKMDGVYFSNQYRESPVAYREYDSKTMRVLGTTSNGKLGFVTATNSMLHNCADSDEAPKWCLLANQSYLVVEDGTPSELTVVTEAEYESLYNVKVTSVTLDKTSISAHVGETAQLTATVLPSNASNKALTWKSTDESVATVSNGLVTMKKIGSTTITATTTDGTNISASCSVTVEPVLVQSITLDKANVELEIGQSTKLNYTITPDNATNKDVTWTTSDASIATVDNGTITAKGVGTADITVKTTDGSNLYAVCKVTVNPVLIQTITLDKTNVELELGQSTRLNYTITPDNATNKEVTWTTSDASIVTVDNGTITAKGIGTADITVKAIDGSNQYAVCKVTVNPVLVQSIALDNSNVDLELGQSTKLNYTITPDNATNKDVTWTTSDASIVTVDNGTITAVDYGTAIITVATTDGSNLTATCEVTCSPIYVNSIVLDKTEATLDLNETIQLTATVMPENATFKEVEWKSSDETVATVTNEGLVTAVSGGQANIIVSALDGSNQSATCLITVIDPSGIRYVNINDCPEGCRYYTVSGQLLPAPRKGLVIVKYPDGNYAKVIVK